MYTMYVRVRLNPNGALKLYGTNTVLTKRYVIQRVNCYIVFYRFICDKSTAGAGRRKSTYLYPPYAAL